MRSMVEGMRRFSKRRRCCASLFAVAPPTALRAVPPPRCAGRDEARSNYINAWMPVWARPRIRA